jgi:uncharacterized caspase-like protein
MRLCPMQTGLLNSNLLKCVLVAFFAIWHQSVALSLDSKYLYKQEPKRIAMVIGNSEYQNLDQLPGADVDADKMTLKLSSLGFAVTKISNVKTSDDFQELYLTPFLDKIEDGAFVVFYFSGHGFTYDGESYLAPALFPKQLSKPVYLESIPAKAVLNTIAGRNPGLVIVILDACRESFDVENYVRAEDKKYVSKGFPATSTTINEIMSYAAGIGKTAAGSSTKELSPYTAALANNIDMMDAEWSDITKKVIADVRVDTHYEQSPWFSDSNATYVWFKSSQKISDKVEQEWESALRRSTSADVRRFIEAHSVSVYAAAARRWLRENANRDVAYFTQVSPIVVDASWLGTTEVKAIQLTGPFAFDRSVVVPGAVVTPPSTNLKVASIAEVLIEAGDVVLLEKTVARQQPSTKAKIVKTYPFGSKLRVLGRDESGTWLRVSDAKFIGGLYLKIPGTVQAKPVDLGDPIREVSLPSRSTDVRGLVDEQALREALAQIRNAGWKITWVSIATPRAGSVARTRVFDAMSNNALLILTDAGVPRGKITTVRGLDLAGGEIRLRFFGTRLSDKRKDAKL